uniref:Uncharacterized protein n=1 Tax=Cacopsylla melanoneura TaxID=428564 RepID=A0A8D9DYM1_9HEMI
MFLIIVNCAHSKFFDLNSMMSYFFSSFFRSMYDGFNLSLYLIPVYFLLDSLSTNVCRYLHYLLLEEIFLGSGFESRAGSTLNFFRTSFYSIRTRALFVIKLG